MAERDGEERPPTGPVAAPEPDGGAVPLRVGKTSAGDVPLREGERRTVTVLFSDMKGFTAISERLDPEEMDALMNRVFTRFEDCVRRRGGTVEKYIGDAMVAVFGASEIHEDDAARAVDAALELAAFARRPGSLLPQDLSFRTGVHTGLVTTGRRGDYDVVTGHTMAVAARLEAAAPPNGVLASAATREACGERFAFSEPRELVLKGKDDRVTAWLALARRKAALSFGGPFIGRDAALERLTEDYVKRMRGAAGGFYLTGDAGIGKTRLASEFWARLKAFPNFSATFLAIDPARFCADEYAALRYAVLDFLDEAAEPPEGEFVAMARDRLSLDPERARVAYRLFRPAAERGDPAVFREALADLFDAILASDGDLYPDVILVDNASAMDGASRSFCRAWLARPRTRPFVVLCDRREDPEIAAIFGVDERLALGPLADEDAARLARALEPEGLDERAVSLVVERSQGYPLFVEEYVKLLHRDREALAVPDSISATILAQVDRLDVEARSLLRKVSVLRYPFDAARARAMHGRTGGAPASVDRSLELLAAEDLLRKLDGGLWDFRHAIVRDAVSSSLLHHNRRLLHAVAASMLREESPEREADVFWHLANAEDWDGARDWLLERRPRLPASHAALVDALVEHCPPEKTALRIELLFQKYAIRFNNAIWSGLVDIVHEMYRLALATRNRPALARTYHLLMTSAYMENDWLTGAFYGRKALDAYEGAGNERGAGNARYFLAHGYINLGDFPRALEAIEGMGRSSAYDEAYYASARAMYHHYRGEHRAAGEWNAAQLAAIEGGAPLAVYERDKIRMTRVANIAVDFEYEAAEAVGSGGSAPCDDPETCAMYWAGAALAAARLGDGAAAKERFAQAEYYLAQEREADARAGLGAWLANCLLLAGELRAAREKAEAALPDAARSLRFSTVFELETILAELALVEGREEEFAFFVRDAAILLGEPILREPRVESRFRYFAWLQLERQLDSRGEARGTPAALAGAGLDAADAERQIARAKELLEFELSQLRDDACRERMLECSVWRRILEA